MIFAEKEVLFRASNGFCYIEQKGNIFMGDARVPKRSFNTERHILKNARPVSPKAYLCQIQKRSGVELPAWKKETHFDVVQDIEAMLGNNFILSPTITDASLFALKRLRNAIKSKLKGVKV